MASVQQLKSRIRSVNSTRQITKAMQLVAASKMRRAVHRAVSAHDYIYAARDLFIYLSDICHLEGHPLFNRRKIKTRLLVVIGSDTGLAGAYNSNVFKKYISELKRDKDRGVGTDTIAVGRKVAKFATRLEGNNVVGTYERLPDDLASPEFSGLTNMILDGYKTEKYDAVDFIYTKFMSSISQEVELHYLLPVGYIPDENPDQLYTVADYIKFEPRPGEVLDFVADRLVRADIINFLSESLASEHSMRMMAMKNATDNATSLSDDLTLAMNKERQAAITTEISDISNGAEAVA
ncbi:MAG: ATP synthase F1 subunit gamma [Candidatus Nomurabacteria bacterium]|jgi:F-type H+-transporting ATPase subunit gamma|nr:ATP synthase F1 subunit gamma [Candidatus Nomurabacteria bacterium]